jgi:hypothetical protein
VTYPAAGLLLVDNSLAATPQIQSDPGAPMARHLVKSVVSNDGQHRLHIYRRADGLFEASERDDNRGRQWRVVLDDRGPDALSAIHLR